MLWSSTLPSLLTGAFPAPLRHAGCDCICPMQSGLWLVLKMERKMFKATVGEHFTSGKKCITILHEDILSGPVGEIGC